MAFHQRNGRNVLRAQLLECRAISMNGAQQLDLTSVKMVLDIDTRAKGPFTRASNHNQARGILHRVAHRRRQLVKHFNAQNIKRRPVKNQPQDIVLAPNMHERHTKYFLIIF